MMKFIVALLAVLIVLAVLVSAAENKGTKVDTWANSQQTTHMWSLISLGNTKEVAEVLKTNPEYASIRAEDGRGPLWWAFEHGQKDIIELLKAAGASDDELDVDGKRPSEITNVGPTTNRAPQNTGSVPPSNSGFDDEDEDV